MHNKIKQKLEKKYKAIFATSKSKIDFPFFLAINEYVKSIDQDGYLRNLMYRSKPFEKANPHNLLIERGRAVPDLNRVFKDKKVHDVLVAYFNLYAIYVGIEDMNSELEIISITENRLKMVKHMEKIRDSKKIVGLGFFWFNKDKYYEWLKIVNNHIFDLLEKDKKKSAPEKSANKTKKEMDYKHDIDNQLVWFTFDCKEIEFKGKRAIVFHFFHTLNSTGNKEYKTYHDFNQFLLDSDINTKINSVAFRQSINNINKRMASEIVDVKSVIELKDKNNPKEINRYRWKIKI